MSDAPNSKIKAISFNLDNEIEAFMFEYANQLKQRKQSFSGLIKHLLMAYLINVGNPPPGIQGMSAGGQLASTGDLLEERAKKEKEQPIKGISKGMPYAFSDD